MAGEGRRLRSVALVAVVALTLGLLTPEYRLRTYEGPSDRDVAHPQATDAAGPPAAAGGRTQLLVGIAYGGDLTWMSEKRAAAALDDAVAVGAGWVRADLSWQDVQADGPGKYRWQPFDRIVSLAKKRKLAVLPVLAYTPRWARPAGCDSPKCAPADPAEFATFAEAAVRRYAPRGIHTWEIWNEPNLVAFWKPGPDPAAYARLLQLTADAVRSVDSRAALILGGLGAAYPGGRDIPQGDFLADVSARGGNRIVAAVGYHPYTYPYLPSATTPFKTPWERMTSGTRSLRSVLSDYGTPDLPLWVTEVGAPTGGPGTASDGRPSTIGPDTTHVTEKRQAQIATDAVESAVKDRHVHALIWHSDRDLGTNKSSEENFYGLRRADGSPKPSFTAFRKAIAAIRQG